MEYPAYFKIAGEDGCTYMRIEGPKNETWVSINGPEHSPMDGYQITTSTHTLEKRVSSSIPFHPDGFATEPEVQSSAEEFKSALKEFYDFIAQQ